MRYNPTTNTTEVLLRGLYFANGVQIAPSQDFLLLCETLAARIWKYDFFSIFVLIYFSGFLVSCFTTHAHSVA